MLTGKTRLSICKLKAAMLFVVGFVVFSCNEDDFLSLSVSELNIPVDGKETTFTIRSNTSWNITVADSWVNVDQSTGNGEAAVTVKINGNYSDNDRTTTLSVSSGALVETISITQSTLSFSLSSYEINFDTSGTAQELIVTANSRWALSFRDETAWCIADVLSGEGDSVITLIPTPYTERAVREGRIAFSTFNKEVNLIITQDISNESPLSPALLTPANGSQGVSLPVSFSWEVSADADGDEVSYFVCLSQDGLTWNDTITGTMETGVSVSSRYINEQITYYWKVIAKDPFGGESESSIFNFTSGESQSYPDGEIITYQTYSAPDATREVNLVVVGDGFIEEDYLENGPFDIAAEKAISAFFSIEPFPTYRDYFTVYKVVAYSDERGATVQGDFINSSQKRQTRNTVFSSVLEGGSSTGIDCDDEAVFDYALRIPALTEPELANTTIIVIINLDVYAGTTILYSDGKSIALCPTGSDTFEEIVYHEAGGHGFGRLLDEYIYYPNQSYPATSRLELDQFRQGNIWSFGANLSVTNDRESVHWHHYFEKDAYEMVGLYEGGGLYGKGVWRPEENSCMNDNTPYFNAPSREAIVRRVMAINNKTFDYDTYYSRDRIDPAIQPMRSKAARTTVRTPLAPPVLKR
ncbi:M64 family metallopeptidase [uncultured Proteiniphilum sp.]|uniref:M64 family metallopeptidase n=1 Tax=uncultured Proteiniphilum sp. TaxID=497637 RepID=UPI0026131FD2|nr:M64 family metallopeptidase [uncultured Proteiniphilum sp.]